MKAQLSPPCPVPPATWPQPFRVVLGGEATSTWTVCSEACQLPRPSSTGLRTGIVPGPLRRYEFFRWNYRTTLNLGLKVFFKHFGKKYRRSLEFNLSLS